MSVDNYELIKEAVEKNALIPTFAIAKRYGSQIMSGVKSINKRITGRVGGAVKSGLLGVGVPPSTVSRIGSTGRSIGSSVGTVRSKIRSGLLGQ